MKGPEDRGLEVEKDDNLEGATVRNNKQTDKQTTENAAEMVIFHI